MKALMHDWVKKNEVYHFGAGELYTTTLDANHVPSLDGYWHLCDVDNLGVLPRWDIDFDWDGVLMRQESTHDWCRYTILCPVQLLIVTPIAGNAVLFRSSESGYEYLFTNICTE